MSNPLVTAFPASDPKIEALARAKGEQLFALMDKQPKPAFLSKKGFYSRLMDWSMKDPGFKAQLFRFVDVLPSLHSSADIVRHLQEYLGDQAVELTPGLKAGLAASSFAPGLIATPVKAQIADMASQFVAGETSEDLVRRVQQNSRRGIATTIDLLGETVVSDAEADVFLQRNLNILDSIAKFYASDREPCFSDIGPNGIRLPRLNLSVKISALTPDVHPADPQNSIAALSQRFRPILRRAREVGALINFDMESYKLKGLTLALFKSIFEEAEFAESPAIGIALQAYLRDCEHDARDVIAWARQHRRPLCIRLVKGAYWDYETITAHQRNWPVPVWEHKAESDANFEKISRLLLENVDVITPNFASHNVRSVAHAIAQAAQLGVDPKAYEFQALYGMADELKLSLIAMGHRVREYCAIGELLPGMAYLVRRLLENTSNEGFLRLKNTGEATRDKLLENPVATLATTTTSPTDDTSRKSSVSRNASFRNAANTDFSLLAFRKKQTAAIEAGLKATAKKWPLLIDGKKITNREYVASVNPARPGHVVGYWARGTVSDAEAAIAAARSTFPAWRDQPVAERAKILERAADLMEARRFELNALEILEAGKPWIEADGDISEAIDFCRYYAAQIRQLEPPVVTQEVPGERCVQVWTPRGVGVAIAPWNFPLAILTGLTVAPLVAGNCVIMKPAEQTTILAATLMELMIEAGVPAGALHFLPGFGEDVGSHLVAHRDIDFIAFTGSRTVGLKIWEVAGKTRTGQRNLKKVVCEMGGKNALIIDNDADLDEAIPAALSSAFGFSGQKCSALSRLIVLDEIYDHFLDRFLSACRTIPVGDPALPGTVIGPVIDQDAQTKILTAIEAGKKGATLAFQGSVPTEGYFVPPCVFIDVPENHPLIREEVFGPVLTLQRAKNLAEALAWANDSDYALTAGIFSRSPRTLERAKRELMAGNLYLNRAITGAIVERHPFGGFKMSGGGTKAGGPGYLENFLFPQSIAENVMRRGFTPPSFAQPSVAQSAR